MKNLIMSGILLLSPTPALAQEAFSTLEEQMTGKEFMDSGLNKLTPEELAVLNDWLQAHSVATLDEAKRPLGTPGTAAGSTAAAGAASGDMRGFENDIRGGFDDTTIVSRIVGPFNGWAEDTIFELENGMVWKSQESSRFHVSTIQNPVVYIDKGLFDSWSLKIEGYNREVRVERIQ